MLLSPCRASLASLHVYPHKGRLMEGCTLDRLQWVVPEEGKWWKQAAEGRAGRRQGHPAGPDQVLGRSSMLPCAWPIGMHQPWRADCKVGFSGCF